MVNSIVGDLTREIIDFVYSEIKRKKNKQKLQFVINNITSIVFENIQPYLYTILAVLIIMFLMNLFQFYYYIKLFLINNQQVNIDLTNTF
jgi:hypothetical protein